jgi:polyphenol oxidase
MVILRADLLTRAGFRHAFPERDTTEADVAVALSSTRIVQVNQVHGARAVEASSESQDADAVVGRTPGIVIGVRVADCVPILVADEPSGAVAAIHAGWRGIVAGVVDSALALLDASSALVAVGPCIGPCCFEVSADVAKQIVDATRDRGVIARHAGSKAYVDLRRAVRAQLEAAGIVRERIEDVPGCTKHESPRFHSFRRDGKTSGRMLAAIATKLRRT